MTLRASIAWAAAVAAIATCGGGAREPVRAPAPASAIAVPARLPDALAPTAYDLELDLSSASRDSIARGHVEISVRATVAVDIAWLHALGLTIRSARIRTSDGGAGAGDAPLAAIAGSGAVIGFRLPRPLAAGDVATLVFDYDTPIGELDPADPKASEVGLFRERANGASFIYSQSESVFARRILPCFDDPRWKPSWRLAVRAGAELPVVLANAREVSRHTAADGTTRYELAPIAAMATDLFAIAAGPFELHAAGTVGTARVPLRLATPPGDHADFDAGIANIREAVARYERYFGQPLPVDKLDIVGVPEFFGAMENPGLITVAQVPAAYARSRPWPERATIDHELAHYWFGDLVGPSAWSELWLSEGLATWLANKLPDSNASLSAALRSRALAADATLAPRPLRLEIAADDEVESTFDETAYAKGAEVMSTLEGWLGSDATRRALRGYVRDRGDRTASTADLAQAFAAIDPAAARVITTYADSVGAPIVDIAVRCTGDRVAIASMRATGATVPACLRYPLAGAQKQTQTQARTACAVVTATGAELALPGAGCPAWLTAHPGGAGYYLARWAPGSPPPAAFEQRSTAELAAYADDVAAAIARGELDAARVIAEVRALAASHELPRQLAAIEVARAFAPFVDDAHAAAWAAFATSTFAAMLAPGAPDSIASAEAQRRAWSLFRADDAPVAVRAHPPPPAFDLASETYAASSAADPREALPWLLAKLGGDDSPDAIEQALARLVAGGHVTPAQIASVPGDRHAFATALAEQSALAGLRWDALVTFLPAALADRGERRALVEAVSKICDVRATAWIAAFAPDDRDLAARAATRLATCAALRVKRSRELSAALGPSP